MNDLENRPSIINDPWIIVQRDGDDDKMTTTLYGPSNATYKHFGIVIGDIIRTVAMRFDVDESDVLIWVEKELDDPTTIILGGKPS